MSKIIERNVAELIFITLISLVLMTSCAGNHYLCDAYASTECENCDELD